MPPVTTATFFDISTLLQGSKPVYYIMCMPPLTEMLAPVM